VTTDAERQANAVERIIERGERDAAFAKLRETDDAAEDLEVARVNERERMLAVLEDEAQWLDSGSYKLDFLPDLAVDALLAAGFGDVAAAKTGALCEHNLTIVRIGEHVDTTRFYSGQVVMFVK